MHRVSVVIPSYNHGVHLRDCVASIRELSGGLAVEMIIIDDGSTDETTIRVISDLGSEPDLKIIRHEKNRGVQAARNSGLKAATGDFVMSVDGDDVLLPPPSGNKGYIFEGARILSENQDIAFVHTLSRMFGDFDGFTISSYPLREDMVARKHHVPIFIMYRRSEILNGLLYMETVRKWQDWAFGVSLLAGRWRRNERAEIGFVRGPGHGYRIHDTGPRISRSQASEYDETKIVVECYQDYFVSKFPDVPNDIDALTAAVVASKPTSLEDLLFVASYNLEQALTMARGREYQLQSAAVDRLGIP